MSKWQVLCALLVGALGGILTPREGSFGIAATLCIACLVSDAVARQRAQDDVRPVARVLLRGAVLGGLTALTFVAFRP